MRAATLALAAAAAVYVLAVPFARAKYPPLTDLPFHAAQVSIIRHYFDPAYQFHDQFSLHPFEVPYVTMYAVGVLAALVLPIASAAKVMAVAMLALLPLGLAVLFQGMRKNPLWGLLGLGFAWTDLTHWGFLSFVGALGLYAASIGCALMVVDVPTRRRQVALTAALVAVFFTHVYRFPYAVLAVALTAAVMYPATRRWRPLLAPVGAALVPFSLWLLLRPPSLSGAALAQFHFDGTRTQRVGQFLFGSYTGSSGAQERFIAWLMLGVLAACIALALGFRSRRNDDGASRDSRGKSSWTETPLAWRVGVTVLPLALAGGHLLAYFVLPARMGEWWYVYPRELVAAAFIAVAAVPELPRRRGLELAVVALIAFGSGRMASFVSRRFAAFDAETADFQAVTARLPPAPKLAYLVIDHFSTDKTIGDKRHSPWVHLPAWVQAERGGTLSFHFAGWGIFPVRYREGGSGPPPVPRDWEWNPSWFRVNEHGKPFDWFLVRLADDPAPIFLADPSIHLVERRGTWWLYRRE